MSRMMTLLCSASVGAALGAGIMYLFDPDRGRRRRAIARERGGAFLRRTGVAASKVARDVRNRMRGLAALAHGRAETIADDILVSRVRTKLGRIVRHPHQVDVTARDGTVTLGGVVEPDEYHRVLSQVRKIAGVKRLEDRLCEPLMPPARLTLI